MPMGRKRDLYFSNLVRIGSLDLRIGQSRRSRFLGVFLFALRWRRQVSRLPRGILRY